MKATVWTIGFRLGLFLSAGRNKTKQKACTKSGISVSSSLLLVLPLSFFFLYYSHHVLGSRLHVVMP